ncbi:MAG: hypothetical protein HUK20_01960, partial [Fibrobacter sp.]|nr:hypothetical protein [Fibrobacter sp.]
MFTDLHKPLLYKQGLYFGYHFAFGCVASQLITTLTSMYAIANKQIPSPILSDVVKYLVFLRLALSSRLG